MQRVAWIAVLTFLGAGTAWPEETLKPRELLQYVPGLPAAGETAAITKGYLR
jgi:hypothetical protein